MIDFWIVLSQMPSCSKRRVVGYSLKVVGCSLVVSTTNTNLPAD
jgi:hypothetical protein